MNSSPCSCSGMVTAPSSPPPASPSRLRRPSGEAVGASTWQQLHPGPRPEHIDVADTGGLVPSPRPRRCRGVPRKRGAAPHHGRRRGHLAVVSSDRNVRERCRSRSTSRREDHLFRAATSEMSLLAHGLPPRADRIAGDAVAASDEPASRPGSSIPGHAIMPGMTEPPISRDRPRQPANRDAGEADRLAERLVESEVVHRGRYLEVRVETTERADGSRHLATSCDTGRRRHRRPRRRDRLPARPPVAPAGRPHAPRESPAGRLDRDPATGAIEDPELASRRELEEETGYRARELERLGRVLAAPGSRPS